MAKGDNSGVGEQLRLLIERAERLKAEQRELKADENDVYAEAKSRGFDAATIKRVIAWRAKDRNKRFEEAALQEVYLAALGQGEGSLSDIAREYLERRSGGGKPDDGQLDAFTPRPKPASKPKSNEPIDASFGEDISDKPDELTIEDAAALGAEAAKAGEPVLSNPFGAGDERRAAWDKAWCAALGSDGMEVPDYLKPTPKPKKEDEE